MPKQSCIVYALRDPVTGFIRYIGKSRHGLKRAKGHSYLARTGQQGHKANWIRSLHKKGLDYLIEILETANDFTLNTRETWWIAWYRPFDHLTNISEGGAHENDASAGGRAAMAKLTLDQMKARGHVWGTKGQKAADPGKTSSSDCENPSGNQTSTIG